MLCMPFLRCSLENQQKIKTCLFNESHISLILSITNNCTVHIVIVHQRNTNEITNFNNVLFVPTAFYFQNNS